MIRQSYPKRQKAKPSPKDAIVRDASKRKPMPRFYTLSARCKTEAPSEAEWRSFGVHTTLEVEVAKALEEARVRTQAWMSNVLTRSVLVLHGPVDSLLTEIAVTRFVESCSADWVTVELKLDWLPETDARYTDRQQRLQELQSVPVRDLLDWLSHARRCGGSYSPFGQWADKPSYSLDELRAELSTRPHVPRRHERRRQRQAAAHA